MRILIHAGAFAPLSVKNGQPLFNEHIDHPNLFAPFKRDASPS